MFRNVTLKCLTEIVSIHADAYQDKFLILFNLTMGRLKQVGLDKKSLFILRFEIKIKNIYLDASI